MDAGTKIGLPHWAQTGIVQGNARAGQMAPFAPRRLAIFHAFRMNPDPTQSASASANSPSVPNRTSNLKSRWKRAPGPGVPALRKQIPANFGEVTDVTAARETLSGRHSKGYSQPVETPAPTTEPNPRPANLSAQAPREDSKAQISADAAKQEATPPAPRIQPRPVEPRREAPLPRESAPMERQEQPRRQQDGRAPENTKYVSLKPDPANDPAPRRLRTEPERKAPVQEYTPSASRSQEKSSSHRHERSHHHRHHESKSSERDRARPDASISAHVPSEQEESKPKKRGILGFIKSMFAGGKDDVREDERDGEDSREERRSSRDRDDDRDSHRHRHHHHGSGDRQSRREERGSRHGSRRS